jgi:hypothetical protein
MVFISYKYIGARGRTANIVTKLWVAQLWKVVDSSIAREEIFLFSVLFFAIERTGTVFRHFSSTDFQSFNPVESFHVQGSSHNFLAYK